MATILYIGTSGSDDPTRATIPFVAASGAVEAGSKGWVGGAVVPKDRPRMGLPRTGFGWTVADPSLAGVDEQRLWMPAMVSLPHEEQPT
jgi:hypothetical protein